MGRVLRFLSSFATLLLIFFLIPNSYSRCESGFCEKISLSLKTNTKHNHSLDGYVFETFNFSNWEECYNTCLRKCECLSFNFNEVNKTENCELNDANTKLAPETLEEKEGVVYYELVRTYYDKNGTPRQTCSDPNCRINKCCDSAPCQHGGKCGEVCDINKRRYSCACPRGFTGHKCQITLPPKSCQDVTMSTNVTSNGIYNIVDTKNISYPVYCDFGSERGVAWTLLQSHSLQNNEEFKQQPIYLYNNPINENEPEWNRYRLSLSRMKSIRDVSTHWRATCNFPTVGVDYQDYWRVSLEHLDICVEPPTKGFCLFSEIVNIRGNKCFNCTVWVRYDYRHALHMDSWHSSYKGCDFTSQGAVNSEDNFGYYGQTNRQFRCASSDNSTTQFWLGSF